MGFDGGVVVLVVAMVVVVMVKVHSRRQHACERGFCGDGGCLNGTPSVELMHVNKKMSVIFSGGYSVEYSES